MYSTHTHLPFVIKVRFVFETERSATRNLKRTALSVSSFRFFSFCRLLANAFGGTAKPFVYSNFRNGEPDLGACFYLKSPQFFAII